MDLNNQYFNTSEMDSLLKIQKSFNNSTLTATIREAQKMVNVMKPYTSITSEAQKMVSVIKPYTSITSEAIVNPTWVAILTANTQNINNMYAPILKCTRQYEMIYNNSMVAVIQSSNSALNTIMGLDFSTIKNIIEALPEYSLLSDSLLNNIEFDTVAKLYEEGKITNEDIADEFSQIVSKQDFTLAESWDNVKKSKWFLAIRILFVILTFFESLVIDKVKNNMLDSLGVNKFWEESGIYEWLDNVFGITLENKEDSGKSE